MQEQKQTPDENPELEDVLDALAQCRTRLTAYYLGWPSAKRGTPEAIEAANNILLGAIQERTGAADRGTGRRCEGCAQFEGPDKYDTAQDIRRVAVRDREPVGDTGEPTWLLVDYCSHCREVAAAESWGAMAGGNMIVVDPQEDTWTDLTFECRSCGRTSRIAADALVTAVESMTEWKDGEVDGAPTSADVVSYFEFCLECATGEEHKGEHPPVTEDPAHPDADELAIEMEAGTAWITEDGTRIAAVTDEATARRIVRALRFYRDVNRLITEG